MRLNRDPSGEKQPGMGAMKGLMLFMPLFSLWVGFQYTTGVGMYLDHIQPSFRCSDDSTLLFV